MTRQWLRLVVLLAVITCVWAAVTVGHPPGDNPSVAYSDANSSDAPVVQTNGADPTVQLRFERNPINTTESTSFVLYVSNSVANDQPIHVMVLVTATVRPGDITMLVDDQRGIEVGDRIVWRFNHDLSPGEYRLSYGTVHRDADPGTYPVEVSAKYSKGDDIAARNVTEMLTIESPPDLENTTEDGTGGKGLCPWLGQQLALVVDVVLKYPQAVAAAAAILALVVSVVESDRIWPALVRLGQRTKSLLGRITRWAFDDRR